MWPYFCVRCMNYEYQNYIIDFVRIIVFFNTLLSFKDAMVYMRKPKALREIMSPHPSFSAG